MIWWGQCTDWMAKSGNLLKWVDWTRGLHEAICTSLHGVGFSAEVVTRWQARGAEPASICNRGARMGGVQLEITRGLRDPLRASPQRLTDFADAVTTGDRSRFVIGKLIDERVCA